MNKISAVIIAKSAEDLIQECIKSVSFCNEIIVVDGGSTDKTVEISKKMGANIFTHQSSDFSEMRNIGASKAKGEWIFYIDADERATPELVKSINQMISQDGNKFSAYKIKRKNFYLGNHEWPHIEYLERVFKREKLNGWYGKLHESPKVDGEIGYLEGFLLHYSHRDLSLMLEKTIGWSLIEAEARLKAGHPKMTWWRFPRIMITAFFDSYIKQMGWKAGTVGIIESMYQSFSAFITYARLWEMQNKENDTHNN